MWRGSLLPLGCAAAPGPGDPMNRGDRYWERFALQREQAPSPQKARSYRDRCCYCAV
ncbi:hypothetical protein C4J87_0208 [Pseudomonas sp. R1-43-08]|nr:hypothetical protein C4J87_0208 [Pseudomonas sp. R1-43-08]AZF50717.1 hypothetical protein C4J85_0200 [Pseudomonas sp. R4-34-07]